MSHIEKLRVAVGGLYQQKSPERDDWADWLYVNHVLWVAAKSRELAEKYGADADLAEAAALLHDIADATMPRKSENHEAESLRIARDLLHELGYDDKHIALIVDDADKLHSCHEGNKPASVEGLVLATADAMAHFQTGFYAFAVWKMGKRDLDDIRAWVLAKLERDFNDKISFDDEHEEVRAAYETLRQLFS